MIAEDGGPLLDVRDLRVYFRILKGTVKAVDGVSFQLRRGETMGLVGESGCGKTTTAYAITRLLPSPGEIVGGEIRFNNQVVGRAHLATEINEALKRPTWLQETKEIVSHREAELASMAGQILEGEEALARESELLEDLRAVLSAGAPSEEELKGIIQQVIDVDLKGWGASMRRNRSEKEQEARISSIRWSQVSMIFQSAMNAFNPVYRVGDQISEALTTHFPDMTKDQARARVLELFDLVGLDRSRVDGFPHEFSGGMRQRSMIAMALACNPQLLIADEPTTALDVIMQDRILAEIRDLQRELNIAMIIITHDISVVAEVAEKIGIMYGGSLFEYGSIVEIFERPANPYTMGLMSAFPSIKGDRKRLRAIPGSPPDLSDPPPGCRFHPRCRFAQEICRTKEAPVVQVSSNHWSQCHFAKEIFEGTLKES